MAYGWKNRDPLKSSEWHKGCVYVCVVLLVIGLSIGYWAFSSMMEAKAYNRATGSNVTTWDAMWIELRVQAGPKEIAD